MAGLRAGAPWTRVAHQWVTRGTSTAVTTTQAVAKVEWHLGELYPRVGFLITNLCRPPERVVAFYNQRGTAEQWIREGKNAGVCHAVRFRPMRSTSSFMPGVQSG